MSPSAIIAVSPHRGIGCAALVINPRSNCFSACPATIHPAVPQVTVAITAFMRASTRAYLAGKYSGKISTEICAFCLVNSGSDAKINTARQ